MNPLEKAAYRHGLEKARSIMVAVTAGVEDPNVTEVMSFVFIALKREIAPLAGYIEPGHGVDYVEMVQTGARARVRKTGLPTATYEIDTPLGKLACTAMVTDMMTWASVYELDGHTVPVRQMRQLGLAQRPTTRRRK